jgi:hypothetical protein
MLFFFHEKMGRSLVIGVAAAGHRVPLQHLPWKPTPVPQLPGG